MSQDKNAPKKASVTIGANKKEEEKKKNTIESIDCPNGSVRYFELEEKWWQKLDKVFFDYSLGDASKIIGCGISPISISKDPDGKVTTAQCPGTSVQYYNSKGEFKIEYLNNFPLPGILIILHGKELQYTDFN